MVLYEISKKKLAAGLAGLAGLTGAGYLAYKNKDDLENLLHKAGSSTKQTVNQVVNKITQKEESPKSVLRQVAQKYKNPEELEKLHKQIQQVTQSSPEAREWLLKPASGKYTADWFWKKYGPR